MTEKYVGVVCWFEPKQSFGYGFLSWSKSGVSQKDLFVHYSDIACEGFKTLKKGQKVAFSIGKNHDGNPKAIDVVVIEETI